MTKALFMQQNLRPGEVYAGLILGKNDEPDYHLFLLADTPSDKLNWGDAKKWAESVNGELPTRREQSLLFANCKEQFEAAWYWSCEQYAAYPDYAWMQTFGNGYQNYDHKSGSYRARAVRRLLLIE